MTVVETVITGTGTDSSGRERKASIHILRDDVAGDQAPIEIKMDAEGFDVVDDNVITVLCR